MPIFTQTLAHIMNLTGNWTGYYEYTIGYALPYFGQRVKLFVDLLDENASLTGTTTEEDTEFAVHHPGTLKGFYEDTFISFVKTYPVLPQIVENQKEPLIEIKEGELEIEHEGFIDQENQAIYGMWTINSYTINPETGEQLPTVIEGIWMLRKDEGGF